MSVSNIVKTSPKFIGFKSVDEREKNTERERYYPPCAFILFTQYEESIIQPINYL